MFKEKPYSIFDLKQYFFYLISNEFSDFEMQIDICYEYSFNKRICSIRYIDTRHITICINLSLVIKKIYLFDNQLVFLKFCSSYISKYVKLLEDSKKTIPHTYLDGLAFLNAIEILKKETKIDVFFPPFELDKKTKKITMRPIEINTFLNSINYLKIITNDELSKTQKEKINMICDSYILFSSLPEIEYNRSKYPTYTLVNSLNKIMNLVDDDPDIICEFPILKALKLDKFKNIDIKKFLNFCVSSNNGFLTGIAVRLIGIVDLSQSLTTDEELESIYRKLIEQYIDYSYSYYRETNIIQKSIISENLFAIKTFLKSINKYIEICNMEIISGKIHPIE